MKKAKTLMGRLVRALGLIGSLASAHGQELSIPDQGLDGAIRDALQKPTGPLTEADLLSLTNLEAHARNISSLEGLQWALNLASLDLQSNHLSHLAVWSALSSLTVVDLSSNPLESCSFPDGLANLTRVLLKSCQLTNLSLPADLVSLVELNLEDNRFTHYRLPAGLRGVGFLGLRSNNLTELDFPTNLTEVDNLDLGDNLLSDFALPSRLTNIVFLNLAGNALTNLALPSGLNQLNTLQLDDNFLEGISLPTGLARLFELSVSNNRLCHLEVPADATKLRFLDLSLNQLTNLVLPADLFHLETLLLGGNRLAELNLSAGMTNLTGLYLPGNQLTRLTLPPDMTKLSSLSFLGNPVTTLVVSELLAGATNLSVNLNHTIATLPSDGVSVFTYPLAVQLLRPRPLTGAFQFGITGPPGLYAIFGSSDLRDWAPVGIASNTLGSVSFVDPSSHLFAQRYYRALPQTPPPNMVFIAPNTFTMGSSTNDLDHDVNETPQTTVVLTRGFWIGQYEVTQGEYLSVMNINPSEFPGELSRPVSSVTWFDATNYCAQLTQRELAAGRIPPGTRFRLPTEAEWECAARAGTSTRFSYGDDPGYLEASNYMWHASNAGLTVHPVGQKLPNPWGLYDMYGNVWEWCLDWYDALPGGVQIDPTGPAGPGQLEAKVMRGGAYDYPDSSCRSASRLFRYSSWPDSDLGFRVVLVGGP